MKSKNFLLSMALGLSVALTIPCNAATLTCKELVRSYVEEDQAPVLMDTTAYYHGTICCRGAKPREGIVAAAPEWYGMACIIYEAIPTDSGYEQGDQIGIFEVLDTGYGKSTGDGIRSKIRKDQGSRGTIEVGKCIDVYRRDADRAQAWMEKTGGKIYVEIIPIKG